MCPQLLDFLRYKEITLASVDKRNDKKVMKRTFEWEDEIPDEYHVDLQDVFKLNNKERSGMADMAAELIDDSYGTMKTKFKQDGHRRWAKNPFDKINREYAAKDAFVSHELYRIIFVVNKAQLHLEKPSMYCPSCKTGTSRASTGTKASAPNVRKASVPTVSEGSSSSSTKRFKGNEGWDEALRKSRYVPKWPSDWECIVPMKKTADGEWDEW